MSHPDPMYENQPRPAVRATIEGLRFFDVTNAKIRQEIEYKYVHYCLRYNLEPVLLIILPDAILFFANDVDGNTSQFLATANSTIVRSLNKRLEHSGPMIKPGKLVTSGILDKDGEIECLAELAAAPTVGIQGTSTRYAGIIFTPESDRKSRRVERPSHLNPETYPVAVINYRIAKPAMQQNDSWKVIEDRLAARRRRIEKENRRKLRAEGRIYPGVNAPEITRCAPSQTSRAVASATIVPMLRRTSIIMRSAVAAAMSPPWLWMPDCTATLPVPPALTSSRGLPAARSTACTTSARRRCRGSASPPARRTTPGRR